MMQFNQKSPLIRETSHYEYYSDASIKWNSNHANIMIFSWISPLRTVITATCVSAMIHLRSTSNLLSFRVAFSSDYYPISVQFTQFPTVELALKWRLIEHRNTLIERVYSTFNSTPSKHKIDSCVVNRFNPHSVCMYIRSLFKWLENINFMSQPASVWLSYFFSNKTHVNKYSRPCRLFLFSFSNNFVQTRGSFPQRRRRRRRRPDLGPTV